MALKLGGDAVHIWLCAPAAVDRAGGNALWRRYRELLADEERERLARQRSTRASRDYLLGRALLRTALSCYRQLPPAAWRFTLNAYGKPALAGNAVDDAGLQFNLSHSEGLVVCAVCRGRPLGVDVESLGRRNDLDAIAGRFFSASEHAELMRLPPALRRGRFFDYWTLKEAYIKARGMGLALPLAQFSLRFGADGRIGIDFAPGIDDRPERWRFWLHTRDGRHRLALCVERDYGERPALICRVPLIDSESQAL